MLKIRCQVKRLIIFKSVAKCYNRKNSLKMLHFATKQNKIEKNVDY